MRHDDPYGDGAVIVGGPPAVRTLTAVTITKIAVGPMDNNAYLLRCRATGQRLLIDAAHDAPTLIRLAGHRSLSTIVTTHRHDDHWQALREVVDATGARTHAGRHDACAIPVPTAVLIDEGDKIHWGRVALTAYHIAGHTPGSIVLLYDDPQGHPHLFTGDCLFPGGPGRTTNPVDFTSLLDGLEEKVFGPLPDETWIYPGHGNDTTLGAERPQLAEWRSRGW
ncbi:MBL fold metallo-hydrolase [Streptomyces sp. NPDC002688]|uniref:MBL fold metallo-hydrolase n=1 Tax=Streptomyces sp. NPDC002688 TaxID=3154423 RepID=UPI00332E327B